MSVCCLQYFGTTPCSETGTRPNNGWNAPSLNSAPTCLKWTVSVVSQLLCVLFFFPLKLEMILLTSSQCWCLCGMRGTIWFIIIGCLASIYLHLLPVNPRKLWGRHLRKGEKQDEWLWSGCSRDHNIPGRPMEGTSMFHLHNRSFCKALLGWVMWRPGLEVTSGIPKQGS